MSNKTIVGFEVDEEFKERIIKAGKHYKANGISFPLNLSDFCRMATEVLMKKIKEEEK